MALVNGIAEAMWAPGGRPRVVFGFTIGRGKIVEIDLVADPARLRRSTSSSSTADEQRTQIIVASGPMARAMGAASWRTAAASS